LKESTLHNRVIGEEPNADGIALRKIPLQESTFTKPRKNQATDRIFVGEPCNNGNLGRINTVDIISGEEPNADGIALRKIPLQ